MSRNILSIISNSTVIALRPEFNLITGSFAASTVLQQTLYWWDKNGQQPFYKFKEPCTHELYRQGDSWCEELFTTPRVFDGVMVKIGFKRGTPPKNQVAKKREDALIWYWTDSNRMTWYEINGDLLGKSQNVVYLVNDKRGFTNINKETEITQDIITENLGKGDLGRGQTSTSEEPSTLGGGLGKEAVSLLEARQSRKSRRGSFQPREHSAPRTMGQSRFKNDQKGGEKYGRRQRSHEEINGF